MTIVVVPREQFSVAPLSLETLYTCTENVFHLVYVDGRSPRRLREHLERSARQRGFRLLRSETYLSPNQARNWGLQHVSTDYVVFMDNDVLVTPGWLRHLRACAEQTGAWAVGPLYLEGDPRQQIIHMAGGAYAFEGERPRRLFRTTHVLQQTRLTTLAEPLRRGPCDFIEFHCMLVRREVFDRLGPLDEALLNTREHLDLCLQIQAAGGSVYFEPEAVVTYRAPPPLAVTDIPYFMLRWSEDWTRRALSHFIAKYGLDPTYHERSVIAAARRAIVFAPVARAASRILGKRGGHWVHQGLSRTERIINRLLVRGSGVGSRSLTYRGSAPRQP